MKRIMSDLISRISLKQSIVVSAILKDKKTLEQIIDEEPSIDAVRHGIWIEENPRPRSSQFYCSVCHRTAYDPQPTRIDGWVKRCRYAYCPNCGARMDGEQDG